VSKVVTRSLVANTFLLAAGMIRAAGEGDRNAHTKPLFPPLQRSLVLDGSCIANAGNLFSVEPSDGQFQRFVGTFVVIR
jgi:hypothetical protein